MGSLGLLPAAAVSASWIAQLSGAAAAGLLSSGHCVGMCGGIVGVLSRPPAAPAGSLPKTLRRTLAHHLGRIATYVTLGAGAGAFGGAIVAAVPWLGQPRFARLVAASFFVAIAFHLVGRSAALAPIERLGGHLWRFVEPFGRPWRARTTCASAVVTGAIWGLLPCGLVYSMLALAAGAASVRSSDAPPSILIGASMMLAFGLGTLPALLFVGAASRGLWVFLRRPAARRVAAACYLVAAAWLLSSGLRAANPPGSAPAAAPHCSPAAPAAAQTVAARS